MFVGSTVKNLNGYVGALCYLLPISCCWQQLVHSYYTEDTGVLSIQLTKPSILIASTKNKSKKWVNNRTTIELLREEIELIKWTLLAIEAAFRQ